ncbi:KAP family P-loop NTPase fold protein [Nioella nitratireducens]|uniref:KAP family P-loop NTPase fold protein n=1 Tax=Nioella nitratireducens TaxID=1287720 RepID=UPI0008FD0430|nr:KAP family NTPase [Nioella nitratireducens]
MWSDRESAKDFLNFTELADQISTLATTADMLPLSIGVFGTWGTGKSTVLRLVRGKLEESEKRPIFIDFDAWLYQGFDDSKAALMEVVADTLLTAAKGDEKLSQKIMHFASRVNYFRAIGMAAEFGVGMAFGVPPGLMTKAGSAISSLVAGTGSIDDADRLGEVAREASEGWSKLVRPDEAKTPPKEIAAFRAEFAEILDQLGRPMIVFVDNLDRCLPDVAIGTLEAIRLFLFLPGTAFVVAADEDMIRHSVAKHFSDPNAKHVHDYLDKVIQVPFRVPRVGVDDVRAYMYSLFTQHLAPQSLETVQAVLLEALQNAWNGASFTADQIDGLAGRPDGLLEMLGTADGLAPTLTTADKIDGNPRIIKRLLNAVMLRRSLAASRKMNVDLGTLAKLAIFERGTDAAATQTLYTLVMADEGDGNLLLKATEDFEEGAARPQVPAAWKTHETFIEEWRQLEPRFNDLKALQPALFLSRDVMRPPTNLTTSDNVGAAVKALLGVTSVNSPAAANVIENLNDDERVAAMSGLVASMREGDWRTKLPGIQGAIMLGERSEGGKRQLKALVEGVPEQTMNAGVKFALRGKGYLKGK